MAKFTVYFKDKAIQTGVYDAGVVHIGRDESNDLIVDSLAVAPAHAIAVLKNGSCLIKQMNDEFPLEINNRRMKEGNLQDNDVINIGKHYIVYNTADAMLSPTPVFKNPEIAAGQEKAADNVKVPDANLQILNGDHIGRMLPLKKAMTRLGREGMGIIVISRRREGYYISALEEHAGLTVNGQTLGGKTFKLNNNDVIVVDSTPLQFFLD